MRSRLLTSSQQHVIQPCCQQAAPCAAVVRPFEAVSPPPPLSVPRAHTPHRRSCCACQGSTSSSTAQQRQHTTSEALVTGPTTSRHLQCWRQWQPRPSCSCQDPHQQASSHRAHQGHPDHLGASSRRAHHQHCLLACGRQVSCSRHTACASRMLPGRTHARCWVPCSAGIVAGAA